MTTTNEDLLFSTLVEKLRNCGIWYDTENYKAYKISDFIAEFKNKIDADFEKFLNHNMLLIQRQCDNYAAKFN